MIARFTARPRPGAGLAEHLQDGRLGRLRVVRRAGILLRVLRRDILQIGQIDLDFPLQAPQGVHPVIAAGVPYHRHRQRLGQQPGHRVGVVGGIDQVDVVGPLVDELEADGPQPLQGDGPAKVLVADGVVLAEDAPQRAAGEKHGAGAPRARDGRLLPLVEGRTGHHRRLRHPAYAGPRSPCAGPRTGGGRDCRSLDFSSFLGLPSAGGDKLRPCVSAPYPRFPPSRPVRRGLTA